MASGALVLIVAAAAALSAGLIVALRPLLQRYALARPNARSSHRVPTPQGGGIAVIAATIGVAATALMAWPQPGFDLTALGLVFGATAFIALVGAVDDIRTIGIAPRLLLQAVAVTLLLAALPAEARIVPLLPWWIERALLLVGCIWFVNLVNFMDGIDWMTVAELVPVTAGLAVLGYIGALPQHGMVVALALGGAMLGFAPFNRPVARLFLGDVGSLPIGLLLGLASAPARDSRPSRRGAAACRSTMSPTPPSPCCGGSSGVSRSGRPTAATSTSGRWIAVSAFRRSSDACSPST